MCEIYYLLPAELLDEPLELLDELLELLETVPLLLLGVEDLE